MRGTKRIGPYEILSEIARGGMGIVYKARHSKLGQIVALKVLIAGESASEDAIKRFVREAQASAKLKHPGIVPIHDFGEEGALRYFTMEYVEGEPLSALIERRELERDPRRAAEILRQAAEALQHAHEQGIIHRDIKPSNIMVRLGAPASRRPDEAGETPAVQAVVMDFGLARNVSDGKDSALSALTVSGAVMGTIQYMSPEQAEAKTKLIGPRSDVYGLGAVLYECLTGRAPFVSDNQLALLMMVADDDPVNAAQINPRAPADLVTITMKCLEKDPAKRYSSAKSLARDLKAFLEDRPIHAKPPTLATRALKFTRRNRAVVGGAAAVFAALSLGLVLTAIQWRRAESERERAVVAEEDAVAAQRKASTDRDRAVAAELATKVERDKAKAAEEAARESAKQAIAEAERARLAQIAEAEQRKKAVDLLALAEQRRQEAETARAGESIEKKKAWEANSKADVERYFNTIELAARKISDSSFQDVDTLLDNVPMALRNWEWGRLKHLCHQELLVLKGHASGVSSVYFSPDGKKIATGCDDGSIKVWDAETGGELLTLKGHMSTVKGAATWRVPTSVCFSPDGKQIASGGMDGTAKLCDAETGREVLTLEREVLTLGMSLEPKSTYISRYSVKTVGLSPDGKRIAIRRGDGAAKVFEIPSRRELLSMNNVTSISFSPDGRQILTGEGTTAKLWDAQGGRLLTIGGINVTPGVNFACFSPDGKWIAIACSTNTVQIYDALTGRVHRATLKGHSQFVNTVCFSPDGKWIVTASNDNTAKVWDVDGRELLTLKGHSKRVSSACFSPDGKRIVTGSEDHTARVWDADTEHELLVLKGHSKSVITGCFSKDGKHVATGSEDDTVKVWNVETVREIMTLKGNRTVCLSPDGKWLATGVPGVGNPRRDWGTRPLGNEKNSATIWDLGTRREWLTLRGHTREVVSICFSPDGKRIATGSGDNTKVWDAESGRELLTLKTEGSSCFWSVCFSPDGRLIAAGNDQGTVRIWDSVTGRTVFSKSISSGWAVAVCFSPDWTRFAVGCGNSVKIWGVLTGDEELVLNGHLNSVLSVCFSPDGKRIMTGSKDHSSKVWDAETGREIMTLKGHSNCVNSVCFSPNGLNVLTASEDGTVIIWPAFDWKK